MKFHTEAAVLGVVGAICMTEAVFGKDFYLQAGGAVGALLCTVLLLAAAARKPSQGVYLDVYGEEENP